MAIGEAVINLREKVVQQLRSEIVSGRSGAGTIYSVPGLATQMGVSTTPVREALLELSRAGLVTPLRNRGFRVEAASLEDLNNLFDVRVLLESHALAEVARHKLTDAAPMVVLADAVGEAVKAHDVPRYIETDRAFHEALVSRANNPLLTKMVMNLRDDMRLYGIDSGEGRKRQLASVDEHYQMIEFGRSGDIAGITSVIRKHILDWKPLFTAALAKTAT
jgi:DNA-binding GntR family transcriptional regulator